MDRKDRDQSEFTGDADHLRVMLEADDKQDPSVWNDWRNQNRDVRPNLEGADLSEVVLHEINLQFTNLKGANLSSAKITAAFDYAVLDGCDARGAFFWTSRFDETQLTSATLTGTQFNNSRIIASNFSGATLTGAQFDDCYLEDSIFEEADLQGASFYQANLWMANLNDTDLRGASLRGATLHNAKLRQANLAQADLTRAVFVDTKLGGANVEGCRVYGISAWNVELEAVNQSNLIITDYEEPIVTVDNLGVAQFVYLLLTNPKLRDVIDTVTTKVVLILGRFTQERLEVLEDLRTALRQHDYVPVLFNFAGPESQNVLATVVTVARLARFVVADVTDAKAVDQELQAIVPQIKVPVRPLLLEGREPPGNSFQSLWGDYPDRLLKIYRYHDLGGLLASLKEKVIDPAEARAKELKLRELEDIFE
jgi:uncharacterized protein YjbI with pentapeptide repeats